MIAVSHSLEENASQRRRYSYDSEGNINKRADYDEGHRTGNNSRSDMISLDYSMNCGLKGH